MVKPLNSSVCFLLFIHFNPIIYILASVIETKGVWKAEESPNFKKVVLFEVDINNLISSVKKKENVCTQKNSNPSVFVISPSGPRVHVHV